MVNPHVAIITTIAASHLGHFKSLQEIAEAKAEIFSGLTPDGIAVINRDTEFYDFLAASAGAHQVVSFGRHEKADVRLKQLALHPTCCCISADVMGEPVAYRLGVPGAHMALNSLAVLAAVKLAGADLARASLALADAAPPKGRGGQEILSLKNGNMLLLDESYNANPESMAAALALLATAAKGRKGRRIAVMGDMLELGEFGPDLHKGLLKSLNENGVDLVYAAGPLMQHLWALLPASQQGKYALQSVDLIPALVQNLQPGDSVVIKGSLGSKMAPVVEALRAQFMLMKKDT
jgi:UDP-N-acetylmuramoyl-tripeptide--D-alanyl-D-alanine ligase